jgi:outer membrane murein-binding lipoprotein Lpp
MTQTPDTAVAALAVQLAALKGNLGQAREDLEAAKRELAARIDQLASDVAAQAGRDPKGPPATCWPALDPGARTAALAVLTEWVAVMRQWHPCYFETVAECWASHPEVVIELHNVMTEFTRIYRMTHPPLADALLLYDRWLPGMLRRCREVMKTCGPAGCSKDRHLMYGPLYR